MAHPNCLEPHIGKRAHENGFGGTQIKFPNAKQTNIPNSTPPLLMQLLIWMAKSACSFLRSFISFVWTLIVSSIPSYNIASAEFKFSKRRFVNWLSEIIYGFIFHSFSHIQDHLTEDAHSNFPNCVYCVLRRCFFRVISVGPIPRHIAFIMDGNRRYARERGLKMGSGHFAGFMSLLSVVDICREMGVKYVTVYAFSIDNFRRKPEFVNFLFTLLQEKLDCLSNHKELLIKSGIKINFIGDLKLLPESIQASAEIVRETTKENHGVVLTLNLAYTSTDEITHAAQESCREKLRKFKEESSSENSVITVDDLERNMYMAELPNPDILVRSSGETRLSNYLLWQTTNCLLVSPDTLWPNMSVKTLVWTVLEYQRVQAYLKGLVYSD